MRSHLGGQRTWVLTPGGGPRPQRGSPDGFHSSSLSVRRAEEADYQVALLRLELTEAQRSVEAAQEQAAILRLELEVTREALHQESQAEQEARRLGVELGETKEALRLSEEDLERDLGMAVPSHRGSLLAGLRALRAGGEAARLCVARGFWSSEAMVAWLD